MVDNKLRVVTILAPVSVSGQYHHFLMLLQMYEENSRMFLNISIEHILYGLLLMFYILQYANYIPLP